MYLKSEGVSSLVEDIYVFCGIGTSVRVAIGKKFTTDEGIRPAKCRTD